MRGFHFFLTPGAQRDISRPTELPAEVVGITGSVRIVKQHLQGPADSADEGADQGGRADLV